MAIKSTLTNTLSGKPQTTPAVWKNPFEQQLMTTSAALKAQENNLAEARSAYQTAQQQAEVFAASIRGQNTNDYLDQFKTLSGQVQTASGNIGAQENALAALQAEYNSYENQATLDAQNFQKQQLAEQTSPYKFMSNSGAITSGPSEGTISQFVLGEVANILKTSTKPNLSVSGNATTLTTPSLVGSTALPALPGFTAATQPTMEQFSAASKLAQTQFETRNTQTRSLLEEAIRKQGKF